MLLLLVCDFSTVFLPTAEHVAAVGAKGSRGSFKVLLEVSVGCFFLFGGGVSGVKLNGPEESVRSMLTSEEELDDKLDRYSRTRDSPKLKTLLSLSLIAFLFDCSDGFFKELVELLGRLLVCDKGVRIDEAPETKRTVFYLKKEIN